MSFKSNFVKWFAPSGAANLPAVREGAPTPVKNSDTLNLSPADLRGREISFVDGSIFGAMNVTSYNPDSLTAQKGLEIYKTMRRDPQAKAALAVKKIATLSSGFEVRAPEAGHQSLAEENNAKQQIDFLQFVFGEMSGGFESKLKSILSALDFGFSVSELVYDEIDYGDFTGKWGLRDLKTRQPYDFLFHQDGHGNLYPDGVSQSGRRMDAQKFLIYSHDSEFNNLFGTSDLRACYDPWWVKTNLLRFAMIALERHATPIVEFTTQGTLSPQQQYMLEVFMNDLQVKSGIVLPPGISLALKEPQRGAADNFLPMLNWLDDQIRISLLVPGLMGMSGEQATGSLARSSTEFDIFMLVVAELRRELETLLNERLVKPLLDLNFDIRNARYARFAFKDLTDSKKTAIFNMWIQAIGAKAVTPRAQDEQRLRGLAGFDLLAEDELNEIDTALENERTEKSNESFFKTETQKRVYEHARDKNFVLKLVERSRK